MRDTRHKEPGELDCGCGFACYTDHPDPLPTLERGYHPYPASVFTYTPTGRPTRLTGWRWSWVAWIGDGVRVVCEAPRP